MNHGIFGSISIREGSGQDFLAILADGTQAMPGCIRYDIAIDAVDADKLWIYEVWETKEHHQSSLQLPSVQAAIARGKALITGFGEKVEFIPQS